MMAVSSSKDRPHALRVVASALLICVVTMVLGNLFAILSEASGGCLDTPVSPTWACPAGVRHLDGGRYRALLFYLMAYVFMNMGAFMVAEVVGDEMSDWGGLSGRSPALAFAMLMFLLSLGGIPFVAGFWAKIFLFMAAWKAGMTGLVILGAMLSVVALYYYMQVGRSIYIVDAPEDRTEIRIGRATAWAIGLCVAGIIVMGVMPDTFLSPAQEAARVVGGGVTTPSVPPAARFLAPTPQ